MKHLITTLALACSFLSTTRALAQDTIVTKNGKESVGYIFLVDDTTYLGLSNSPISLDQDYRRVKITNILKIKLAKQSMLALKTRSFKGETKIKKLAYQLDLLIKIDSVKKQEIFDHEDVIKRNYENQVSVLIRLKHRLFWA